LVLALIYIVAISLIVVALADWVSNDLSNTTKFNDAAQFDSALRSVVQLGIQNIRYNPMSAQVAPGVCWTPDPSTGTESGHTFNGYSVDVWCSTVQDLNNISQTRVVTLYACLSSASPSAATDCQNHPSLTAKVAFDDYYNNSPAYLSATCTPPQCGQSATALQWTWGTIPNGIPSPSTTTTSPPPSSTTSTTTSTTSTTTSTTSTTTTSTTTTTTSTTTTTVVTGKKLVILSQPQTFATTNSSAGTTSGSFIIQSQTSAGVPITQSSSLTVTLSHSTNGSLTGSYAPSTITIPANSSVGIAVFSITGNSSSSPATFTVAASASGYTSSLNQTETVQSDANSTSTSIGAIASQSIPSSGATVTYTVPINNQSGFATQYYEVTAVGGVLAGESVGGSGYATCLAIRAGRINNASVNIGTSSTRFAGSISPTTVSFEVTQYTSSSCTTESGSYFQGDSTLTVG
jgi:hypothetical protein